jgi:hypothetical protein
MLGAGAGAGGDGLVGGDGGVGAGAGAGAFAGVGRFVSSGNLSGKMIRRSTGRPLTRLIASKRMVSSLFLSMNLAIVGAIVGGFDRLLLLLFNSLAW